ncbi:hypothetical protein IFM89_035890 [Coptis chinensis]|uniref:ABC-2 type transporter transmembrane domain-containing protein n=1 Tax=Coptis chinensis TaxID=261450 RepID=A0A835LFH9_9MAGN|nr:hypothetical protein IFM89_035890 [Coptis chinensis]
MVCCEGFGLEAPEIFSKQETSFSRDGIATTKEELVETTRDELVVEVGWSGDWTVGGRGEGGIGLFFFYTSFWCFFPLFQAIFTFPQERMMLTNERSSGMYRLSFYFMPRIVGDLPMELVLPTIFLLITYLMAGLKLTVAHFFGTWFALLNIVLVAQGLGLALGSLVMDLKCATTLGSVIILAFLLAGGYYVQHVPAFIGWIKYISLSQYTYKLFLTKLAHVAQTSVAQWGAFQQYKWLVLTIKALLLWL